jgi:hypothetical protein
VNAPNPSATTAAMVTTARSAAPAMICRLSVYERRVALKRTDKENHFMLHLLCCLDRPRHEPMLQSHGGSRHRLQVSLAGSSSRPLQPPAGRFASRREDVADGEPQDRVLVVLSQSDEAIEQAEHLPASYMAHHPESRPSYTRLS